MSLSTGTSCRNAVGIALALIATACAPAATPAPTSQPTKPALPVATSGPTPAPAAVLPTAAPAVPSSKHAAVTAPLTQLHQQALASGQTKVTHYATFGVEADPLIEQFQRSSAGVQVERVQLRTPEIIQRLAAEV